MPIRVMSVKASAISRPRYGLASLSQASLELGMPSGSNRFQSLNEFDLAQIICSILCGGMTCPAARGSSFADIQSTFANGILLALT
eukprot:4840738-Pyramimonas_sp.AAC.1